MALSDVKFSFEDLEVWRKSVEFADKVTGLVDELNTDRKHYRLIEQLESCSMSIALNIAEGKGRHSKKEFIQFLYIARGSLYETVTLLILFSKKGWISDNQLQELRIFGGEIGMKISSLINSIKVSIQRQSYS